MSIHNCAMSLHRFKFLIQEKPGVVTYKLPVRIPAAASPVTARPRIKHEETGATAQRIEPIQKTRRLQV
ncbi:hypothetical protein BELL_0209g00120 [Botrytis elliptica]|uniref:Uncharacterized protein n=1 Tax=Botrytis elliptica TaxID=278938 RepID=A0A4Z1JV53_9HELO|nr:hypothetical protein BELL_0209g00120 [Botrytis elliptica]